MNNVFAIVTYNLSSFFQKTIDRNKFENLTSIINSKLVFVSLTFTYILVSSNLCKTIFKFQDFKLASNSRQTSVVEQHPEVGSTTGGSKHQISILEVR